MKKRDLPSYVGKQKKHLSVSFDIDVQVLAVKDKAGKEKCSLQLRVTSLKSCDKFPPFLEELLSTLMLIM